MVQAAYILVEAEQTADSAPADSELELQQRLMETMPVVFESACEDEGVSPRRFDALIESTIGDAVVAKAQAELESVTARAMEAAFVIADGSKTRLEGMEAAGLSEHEVAA
jgi:hypothetical protein